MRLKGQLHKEKSVLDEGNSLCKGQMLGRTGLVQLKCGCKMKLRLIWRLRVLTGESAGVTEGQG